MTEPSWAEHLAPGERIVWEGAPGQGVRFGVADVANLVFGAFFTAISLVFVVLLFPWGLLIPHLWVGLYFMFGHLLVERKTRATTHYALTDTRALIDHSWPSEKFTAVSLASVQQIGMSSHRDGTATIVFGGPAAAIWTAQSLNRRAPQVPSFDFIEGGDHVMQLAQQGQATARQTTYGAPTYPPTPTYPPYGTVDLPPGPAGTSFPPPPPPAPPLAAGPAPGPGAPQAPTPSNPAYDPPLWVPLPDSTKSPEA